MTVLGTHQWCHLPRDIQAPQPGKPALIVMFIQFGPLDRSAVWLQYPANIKALAEKLARHMNRMVA